MTKYEIKAKLQEKFDSTSGLDEKGIAFIHVAVIGPDGSRYGSYDIVHESSLIDRDIEYDWYNGEAAIVVLDADYDPNTFKWGNPLN